MGGTNCEASTVDIETMPEWRLLFLFMFITFRITRLRGA